MCSTGFRRSIVWLFLILPVDSTPTPAAGGEEPLLFEILPVPSWVEDVPLDRPEDIPTDQVSAGLYSLLLERQDNELISPPEFYARWAELIVNEQGVQNGSQISIDFDPSYQELILHSILLHRDGRAIERLDSDQVNVIQRETLLEFQIYDGTHTAVVFLEDVRIGDIVEARYTIRGRNPVFGDRYEGAFPVQVSLPMHRLRFRIIWPSTRTLHLKNHGTDASPTIRELPGRVEYLWNLVDVEPLAVDGDLPIWYDPYPRVQMSEYGTWNEVAVWGADLFNVQGELSRPLRDLVDRIERENSDPEDLVIASLRFLQDEIRYLGFEFGSGSHRPSTPNIVFERRFGDCKDKSLLFASMLRHMNVSADPVLIHTRLRSSIQDWHPSPLVFNHCIVRVRLDGQYYWFDPSERAQGGALSEIYIPNYEKALVLNEATMGLSTIGRARVVPPSTKINLTFRISGTGDPVELRIESTYRGRTADNFRLRMKEESRDDVAKRYLNYYAKAYPSIIAEGEIEVFDDLEENIARSIERYSIPDFWDSSQNDGEMVGQFYALELQDLLQRPSTTRRTMPLAVSHLSHMTHTTEVFLPEEYTIEPRSIRIENVALQFSHSIQYSKRKLRIHHEFKTLADHVSAEDCEVYLRDLDEIEQLLGFEIFTSAGRLTPTYLESMNWPIVMILILAGGASVLVAIRVYRVRRPAVRENIDETMEESNEIVGWLILLGLLLASAPVVLIGNLILACMDTLGVESWVSLTTPGLSKYHPAHAPVLLLEGCANIILLTMSVLIVVLFFKKRRVFPVVFTLYALFGVLVKLLDLAVTTLIFDSPPLQLAWDYALLAIFIAGGAFWAIYLLCSRRARETFVQ